MNDDRDIRTRLDGMFDDLDARAQRMSAEDMAQRPIDQPSGAPARMSAQYESVSGGGGVRIENLRKLYDEGICESCLVPLGRRTRVPMRVFFDDGQSRWYDGLLAQLDERPRGPTYRPYTQRFLDWLLPDEQHCLKWREVIVVNATKITRRIFEPLPSRVHVAVATLRGGYIERAMCSACGRGREASYPLAGSFPNWLNPEGSTRHTGQPRQYPSGSPCPIRRRHRSRWAIPTSAWDWCLRTQSRLAGGGSYERLHLRLSASSILA